MSANCVGGSAAFAPLAHAGGQPERDEVRRVNTLLPREYTQNLKELSLLIVTRQESGKTLAERYQRFSNADASFSASSEVALCTALRFSCLIAR